LSEQFGSFGGGSSGGGGSTPTANISIEILDTEEIDPAVISYTFTPAAALTNDKYSKIVMVIDGEVTTGTQELQLVINGHMGTTNDSVGYAVNGGAIVSFVDINTDHLEIHNSLATSHQFFATIELYMSDLLNGETEGFSTCMNNSDEGRTMYHVSRNADGEITSLKIFLTGSTFKIGTKITTYGYLRSMILPP